MGKAHETETNKRAELAAAFYAAFEHKTRDSGEAFYCLKDDAPDWMTAAIRDAHDNAGIMPNDWIYNACHSAVSSLNYYDPDDWNDSAGDIADGMVDVYNSDRAAWLASDILFGEYVSRAVEEFGRGPDADIYNDLGMGQYMLASEIVYSLIAAIEAQADEDDEDEDD